MADSATEIPFEFSKYLPRLTDSECDKIKELAKLPLASFGEADVREEFLAPLISILGYRRGTDYEVLREETFKLSPLFTMIGRQRYELDYQFVIWKQGFWLLEAKPARCSNPSNPPALTKEDVGQAFSYSLHPKIDAPYFAVSNGWWTELYDRDGDSADPILSFSQAELPDKFEELRQLVDARQITFHLKRRLIDRVEQVLAADIDLERTKQFVEKIKRIGYKVQPKVLDNWRAVMADGRAAHKEIWEGYLTNSQPDQLIETSLLTTLSVGHLKDVSSTIVKSLRIEEDGFGQASMFFHKLFLDEVRSVTLQYYFNSLNVLAALAAERNVPVSYVPTVECTPVSGKRLTTRDLFFWWADILLHHLQLRPELRMLWAVEGLFGRIFKRLLVYERGSRADISTIVQFDRHLFPEELVSWIRPSPALTVVQTVEAATMALVGEFLHAHYDPKKRDWKTVIAQQSWLDFLKLEKEVESQTPDYFPILQELGEDWSELANLDYINRDNDLLGTGVCAVLNDWPELLVELPEKCRQRIDLLAGIGLWSAKKCAKTLKRPVKKLPTDQSDIELCRIFDPLQ